MTTPPARLVALAALLPLLAAEPAAAGPAAAGPTGTASAGTAGEPSGVRRDCRYLTTEDRPAARGEGAYEPVPFPDDDLFRPLLADPKQPQFFASYQRLGLRQADRSLDAAFVGFGESFGLYGLRSPAGCDGLQVGVAGAVFSQFDLDAPSFDLINSDFVIGVPVSLRRGLLSARVRLYHQSSHVGDEFLLGNPGFDRLNFSFEEVEALVSVEHRWWRLYGGGGYLVHREPAIDRGKLQWGLELRGARHRSSLFRTALGEPRVAPVFGADFKAFEALGWSVNTSLAGGLEWSGRRATRRLRLLATYLRGFNPYGQFFDQKIWSAGLGVYFAF